MQHQRRAEKRQRVAFSVELHQPGRATLACRAHNLTPDGMLLENSRRRFEPGANVELRASLGQRTWCVPARVTHCNDDCLGIMFEQRQTELFLTVTQPMMRQFRGGGRRRYFMRHQPD